MSEISKTIEVDVPVSTAYNQWTQFESFPQFMEGVESVTQLGDEMTHWKTNIAGVDREFDARITKQQPDRCVSWRTVSGPEQGGTVTFSPAGPQRTTVKVDMLFQPEGMTEMAGDKLGIVERRVEGDLERFKEFIEHRGTETGAWRGTVQ